MLDVKDLYEQVAGEIRHAIAEGEAKRRERLPPAKDLAAILGVIAAELPVRTWLPDEK